MSEERTDGDLSNPTGGPYLIVAAICEQVLQEQDGVLSAIRLIDRVTLTHRAPEPREAMPPIPIEVRMLICFRSGMSRGRQELTIRTEAPTGLRATGFSTSMQFEGAEDRGVNVILPLRFQAEHEGVYWFDVLLDNRFVTRTPLRVVYQRQRAAPPIASPG